MPGLCAGPRNQRLPPCAWLLRNVRFMRDSCYKYLLAQQVVTVHIIIVRAPEERNVDVAHCFNHLLSDFIMTMCIVNDYYYYYYFTKM